MGIKNNGLSVVHIEHRHEKIFPTITNKELHARYLFPSAEWKMCMQHTNLCYETQDQTYLMLNMVPSSGHDKLLIWLNCCLAISVYHVLSINEHIIVQQCWSCYLVHYMVIRFKSDWVAFPPSHSIMNRLSVSWHIRKYNCFEVRLLVLNIASSDLID